MTDFHTLVRLRRAALVLALGAGLALAVAFYFEWVLGYVPCKLCLIERLPYYAAIPLALLSLVAPERLTRLLLGLAAAGLLYAAGLSVYHAGAEWGLWAGPTDCGGGSGATPASSMADFRTALEATRVADCSTAALRILGVSLAGWNAVVAAILASVAGTAALRK